MDVEGFLQELEHAADYRDQIQAVRWIAPRSASFADLSPPVAEPLAAALRARGIDRLYVHQARAIGYARAGRHVAVVSGTASGKSLVYHIAVLEALLADRHATALYLFPTKALAQDQLRFLRDLTGEDGGAGADPWHLVCGTYDGDTPPERRRLLRERSRLLLTNPDMLHSGILGHHLSWGRFFRGLSYVVIDEMHVYRGLFGSHVANVLRRLLRIARQWGRSPAFVLCSATIRNPREMAAMLTGQPVEVVDEDGSPRGRRCVVLWNPPRVGHPPARRSANLEAAELMSRLIARGAPTISFGRARTVAELLYRYTRERLERLAPSRAGQVAPYRGGYLAGHRREIERRLFSGELLGVCSTNALELGIDVGELEAALLVGYPGSIASLWQQAGRAGRKQEAGLVVLLAHDSPVDQYLVGHPDYLFGHGAEPGVLNPDNPQVILGHLRAAAYEMPVLPEELARFGPHAEAVMQVLYRQGEVFWDGRYWRWKGTGYPAGQFGLRTASETTYTIMEMPPQGARAAGAGEEGLPREGHVIGSLDEASAFFQLHPEAVYLHDGETYLVERLDLEGKVAWVRRERLDYFTQAVAERRVRPVLPEEGGSALTRRSGGAWLHLGDAVVTQMVYMFKKIRFESRDSLGWGKVDLPASETYTMALSLTPDGAAVGAVTALGRNPVEAMWGMANALVGVLPLFVGCDAQDVGAVVDTGPSGAAAVYLYDTHPGGAGFARQAFEDVEAILEAARELVARCPCDAGCPSCVGAPLPPSSMADPDTSPRGRVPDKQGALRLLDAILRPGEPSVESGDPYQRPPGVISARATRPASQSPPETSPDAGRPPPVPSKPLPDDLERRLIRQLRRMAQRDRPEGAGDPEWVQGARGRPRPGR